MGLSELSEGIRVICEGYQLQVLSVDRTVISAIGEESDLNRMRFRMGGMSAEERDVS
jgi:small ligand-binding sensory domain FIST